MKIWRLTSSLVLLLPFVAWAGEYQSTTSIVETNPSMPSAGVLWEDPDFPESVLLRIATPGSFTPGADLHPEYSDLQAWSSDNRLLLINSVYVVDMQDLSTTGYFGSPKVSIGGDCYKARWSPLASEPSTLYCMANVDGANPKLTKIVINTTNWTYTGPTDVHTFSELLSFDGRGANQWQEMAVDSTGDLWTAIQGPHSDNYSYFAAYNITDNKTSNYIKIDRGAPNVQCDHLLISPLVDHILLQCAEGTGSFYGMEAFHFVYNQGSQTFTTQPTYAGKVSTSNQHNEVTLDENGDQWAVYLGDNYLCPFSGGKGTLFKAKIPNGYSGVTSPVTCAHANSMGLTVSLLEFSDSLSGHVSCRNSDYGDWCVVSTYTSSSSWSPLTDEIFKIYLDSTIASPHVDRLAHHRSHPMKVSGRDTCSGSCTDYYSQPHATPNRDGTLIFFGSNWGRLCNGTTCTADTPIDPFLLSPIPGLNIHLRNLPANKWKQISYTPRSPSGGSTTILGRSGFSGAWYGGPGAWAVFDFGGGGHAGSGAWNDSGNGSNAVRRYRTSTEVFQEDYDRDANSTYPYCNGSSCNWDTGTLPFVGATSYCNVTNTATPHSACNPAIGFQPYGTTSNDRPWTSHSYDQGDYDPINRRFLYYGPNYVMSYDIPNYYGFHSSHAYDPATKTWSLISATEPNVYHQGGWGAVDPSNKMWVVGGYGPWMRPGYKTEGDGTNNMDAWAMNLDTNVWHKLAEPPTPASEGVMVFDSTRYRMLLPPCAANDGPSELYALSGYTSTGTWSQVTTTGTKPPNINCGAAYDPRSDTLLLMTDASTALRTLPLSTNVWGTASNSGSTPPAYGLGSRLTYDPVNNVTYLLMPDGYNETIQVWAYRNVAASLSAEGSDTLGAIAAVCGNGSTETGETCDDGNTTTETACPYGTPTCVYCRADCGQVLNLTGPYCGDGTVQTGNGEVCDTLGPNLNGQSCVSQGFTGGSLSCNTGCTSFNTSGCTYNPQGAGGVRLTGARITGGGSVGPH